MTIDMTEDERGALAQIVRDANTAGGVRYDHVSFALEAIEGLINRGLVEPYDSGFMLRATARGALAARHVRDVTTDAARNGDVVIRFNRQAVKLLAPDDRHYLPCDGCGDLYAVPIDVVSFRCDDNRDGGCRSGDAEDD